MGRGLCGPGDAPVAAQDPARVGRDAGLGGGYAVDGGDSAAQHGHLLAATDPGHVRDQSLERCDLLRLDIDEEECRRVLGELVGNLSRQIALDRGHRDQHRQAKTQ